MMQAHFELAAEELAAARTRARADAHTPPKWRRIAAGVDKAAAALAAHEAAIAATGDPAR